MFNSIETEGDKYMLQNKIRLGIVTLIYMPISTLPRTYC